MLRYVITAAVLSMSLSAEAAQKDDGLYPFTGSREKIFLKR
jgi:hypothetical protein